LYVNVVDIGAKPLVVGMNCMLCVIFVTPVTLYEKLYVGDAPPGMLCAARTEADLLATVADELRLEVIMVISAVAAVDSGLLMLTVRLYQHDAGQLGAVVNVLLLAIASGGAVVFAIFFPNIVSVFWETVV
jgi:hypothetical protein